MASTEISEGNGKSCGVCSENVGIVDFEGAIKLTGYGWFHWGLVLSGSLCMLCAGFQNALNGYIIPSASCDLQMTTEEMGLLNSIFLAGGITSAYLCGLLADLYGRKTVILTAMVLDAVFSFISSFSQIFWILLVFRFLNGFVVGAPASLVIPYVGEFHAAAQRTTSICYIGFFWALAWMLVPGFAWIIIPITWSYRVPSFTYNSWRLFVALFAIPSTLAAVSLSFYPESPRFLLAQGRNKEALQILQNIYAKNTGNKALDYPVNIKDLSSIIETVSMNESPNKIDDKEGTPFLLTINTMWRQTKSLLKPPYLSYTIICSSLMFANMFGAYGLGLWLPELIQRFQEHHITFPNQSVTMCELSHRKPLKNVTLVNQKFNSTKPTQNICDGGNIIDQRVFVNTLIIGSACLVGDISYGIFANFLSNRIILSIPMLLAGICGLALYFLRTSTQILVVSCLFQAGVEAAYFGIYSVVIDNFPTSIRAIAMCTAILAGRIGAIIINMLFGELLDTMCEVPIFLIAGVLIVGGFLSAWVPTKQSARPTPPTRPTVYQPKYSCKSSEDL